MNLTARYVTDSRHVIADVETTDTTNPELPRHDLVVLLTRSTETLRTMTDHAERLSTANEALRGEITRLEKQLTELKELNEELKELTPATT